MILPDPGFALYIHWPFCLSKCPYCDFNSHVSDAIDQSLWRDALLSDLDHYGRETEGHQLTSVFFGGGTPSLMAPETVGALIDKLGDYWRLDHNLEVTLEANPTSVELSKFKDFRTAGVNRVSIGVQALDDETLKFLGRGHSADEARRALAVAGELFERFSFDLIYARPGQTSERWRMELAEALALAGDHLSLYQLSIETGTPFHRDGVETLENDAAADLFELTQALMEEAGLPGYEISNHARPGSECRHNLTYWRGGDYVGIGPGAHGRLSAEGTSVATHQIHNPENWLKTVETHTHGTAKRRPLSPRVRAEELVMMGLRLRDGFDSTSIPEQTGLRLSDLFDITGQQRLIDGGFLEVDGSIVRATAEGRMRLNSVIEMLLS
jgi:putative oxygen-independent coproporphyrinogen III oxidase